LNGNVADLSGRSGRAAVNMPIDQQARPHPAAHLQISQVTFVAPGSISPLTKGAQFSIVAQRNRALPALLKLRSDRETIPTWHNGRGAHHSGIQVHRTRHANPNRHDIAQAQPCPLQQVVQLGIHLGHAHLRAGCHVKRHFQLLQHVRRKIGHHQAQVRGPHIDPRHVTPPRVDL